ncbi:hypothetical protein DPMN_055566 [Dreissena polymorpha]|uniref:Uncharacterized protein n=1 Tax=Dreissena polymorpha TaxID=45954 RepID=A0A9D4HSE7_DREPO|nr:hypothetical protein DPMN_055566 [Dreissena polymorpha]
MANHMVHKTVRLDATKTSADDSEKQQRKLICQTHDDSAKMDSLHREISPHVCGRSLTYFHCKWRRFH